MAKLEEIEKLPWKGRKFIYGKLPFMFLDQMVTDTVITGDTNKERGFLICADKSGQFYSTASVQGTEKNVPIYFRCQNRDTAIGMFHTHPDKITSLDFSFGDITSSMGVKFRVICVGVPYSNYSLTVEKGVRIIRPRVNIKCMIFNTQHPEFDEYRKRMEVLQNEYEKANKLDIPDIPKIIEVLKKRDKLLEEMSKKDIVELDTKLVEVDRSIARFDIITKDRLVIERD